MTLEEAIRHAEDKATDLRETADYYKINGSDYMEPADIDECEKCAEEHAQLAEWLTELKAYKECQSVQDECADCDACINSKNTWHRENDKAINNATTVEITEEQAIDKLHETGWLIEHDKEMITRPQGEWIDHSETDGHVECPFCGSLTTCWSNKVIEELHYCFNCGAELGKGGAE